MPMIMMMIENEMLNENYIRYLHYNFTMYVRDSDVTQAQTPMLDIRYLGTGSIRKSGMHNRMWDVRGNARTQRQ